MIHRFNCLVELSGAPLMNRFMVVNVAAAPATDGPRWLDGEDHTNDTSYGAAATGERDLTADELDQIAGGTPSIPIPPPTPHRVLTHAVTGFFKQGGTHV
jgi:hypothetical protein